MRFKDVPAIKGGPTGQQLIYGIGGVSARRMWREKATEKISEIQIEIGRTGKHLPLKQEELVLPPPPVLPPAPSNTPPTLMSAWWITIFVLIGPLLGITHVYLGGNGTVNPVETAVRAVIWSGIFTTMTSLFGVGVWALVNQSRKSAFANTHRTYHQQVAYLQGCYQQHINQLTHAHQATAVRREEARKKVNELMAEATRMTTLLDQCRDGTRTPLDADAVAAFGKDVQNWALGAAGELDTHGLLAESLPGPAIVLHDVAVPGSKTNLDHIVLTPHGLFVIDTKNWSGRYGIRNNKLTSLTSKKNDRDDPGGTLWWEIDQAAGTVPLLADTAAAIIVIHSGRVCDNRGTETDRITYTTSSNRPVTVVNPRGLITLLTENADTPIWDNTTFITHAEVLLRKLEPACSGPAPTSPKTESQP
ncbi:MAG: nuclease-related domain-containing protein [Gordonia sp. (in: high G+C Gram-positive bacteria)]|uniref:nuclease-related domain-containing protein n=1 Tax=Gordonia sp. (in: high G+C Gram-positive bacteria) TaxID=84139 RepID=UPI0039E63D81